MKQAILVIVMAGLSLSLRAQGFFVELGDDNLSAIFGNESEVTLNDGSIVKGKLTGGSLVNGYLKSISLKDEAGEKHKFKAADMTLLRVKASKLVKFAMMTESSSSIKEMTKANFEEIVNRDYVIFERASKVHKDDKYAMMQLLNPGFDSKIKVYADPNARETNGVSISGVQLTGGVEKSYLFVKNGESTVFAKKKNYRKNFEELYSDCPKMMMAFGGEKIKWQDLAGHVFAYDRVCE